MSIGSPQVQRIPFSYTVQPGVQPANPAKQTIVLGDVWCYSIELDIPRGFNGEVGFAIFYAGTQLMPFSQAQSWLILNDFHDTYEIETEFGNGLQLVAYNQGFWPHTIMLRFLAIPISAYQAGGSSQLPQPIDLSGLGQ